MKSIRLTGLIALAFAPLIAATVSKAPSRYLYVWAGTGMDSTHAGVDMITVIDANPASKTYGSIVAAQTAGSGYMPHHTEYVLPTRGSFFANDYFGDKSFLIDFTDPLHPKSSAVARVPGTRRFHTFMRLPNGNVVATYQFGDGKVTGDPGGLAEFDSKGRLLKHGSSRDPAFPKARIRTYGLTLVPRFDRAVTTSSPMDNERPDDVIQIWRLSDLKLLRTIKLDVMPDSSQMNPFEMRALADGSVFINTYHCGFYRLTDLATNPKLTRVFGLHQPENFGCSVPLIAGKFWIMPIAYAHRYVTLDISNPDHPVEVSSFPTDTSFYPHWIAADPNSDRVVVTDQGDGPGMVKIMHLDRSTGRLSWDEKFRDAGGIKPGVSYRRASWPNGVKGMAMPHGALFVP